MTSSRARAYAWPYPRHRRFQVRLQQAAARWFRDRGLAVSTRYSYILASRDDWPQNIILPEVAGYVREVKAEAERDRRPFALHRYIHHGLSSQALLFNLIGPLMVSGDWRLLREVFGAAAVGWPEGRVTAELEYEDRDVFNEDTGQPTSIDLVLRHEDGRLLAFVECKFTESEFGGCSVFGAGDCDGRNPAARNPAADLKLCYLHFIGRSYWTLLQEHGFLDGPLSLERLCPMAAHYQFFRVLLFALAHRRPFVLLYDERSPVFSHDGPGGRRGLLPVLLPFVPEHLRDQVVPISIQEALEVIKASGRHAWVPEFKRKYGLA
jgi:hypothetical protein